MALVAPKYPMPTRTIVRASDVSVSNGDKTLENARISGAFKTELEQPEASNPFKAPVVPKTPIKNQMVPDSMT
jgi:hypothetical protein